MEQQVVGQMLKQAPGLRAHGHRDVRSEKAMSFPPLPAAEITLRYVPAEGIPLFAS